MIQPSPIQDRSGNAGRSAQMIQCLRRHLLYADKRTRDALFLAAERLILCHGAREGVMLSRLTRDAVSAARGAADSAEPVNWEMAGRAVVNAMLRAGVLLDAKGNPIPKGIAAQAVQVIGLEPNYRNKVEAFLLEFLIRELGDVSTRDHKALAHALFRQFDPRIAIGELEDRVVILLASLEGSVVLRDDGVYVIASTPSRERPRAAS